MNGCTREGMGLLVALALTGVASAADRTWNRTTTNPGTEWSNPAHWNGAVPGQEDRAVFPSISPIPGDTCRPTLGENEVVTVNGIYMHGMYQTSATWQILNANAGAPGKLVLGSGGIENRYRCGGFAIYPDIELAADQTWQMDPDYADHGPTLYGLLSGTGRLTRGGNSGSGESRYMRRESPTFSGGLTVEKGSFRWSQVDLTSSDAGSYGFGSAPITLAGGGFIWSCTALPGNDGFVMDLTNSIVVNGIGQLRYHQAGGSGYYPNCRFSGPVDLNGILRMHSLAYPGNAGLMPKYEGTVTINREQYAAAGLSKGDNNSGTDGFDPQTYNANIVDGAGPSRKPLVLQAFEKTFQLVGTANTYSGGTVVSACGGMTHAAWHNAVVTAATDSSFGVGDLFVLPSGRLRLTTDDNLAPDALVRVRRTACDLGVLSLAYDGLPDISADSEGVLALETSSFTALSDLSTLGNGRMFLGAGRNGGTFTGASLAPGADNVYRLGGGNVGNSTLTIPNGVLTGATTLQVGQHAWWGNSIVRLNGANTFTGPTHVSGSLVLGNADVSVLGSVLAGTAQTVEGASPFGSASGAITLSGSQIRLYGANGGEPVVKGTLGFSGLSRVSVDANTTRPTTFEVAGLSRLDRGVLRVDPIQGSLGANETLRITDQPDSAFLPPYLLYHSSKSGLTGPDFTTYDQTGGTGVGRLTAYHADLLTSSASDVVAWAGALGGGTYAAKALKTTGAVTGSGTLNLGDGTYAGLILGGNLGDTGTTLDFGTAEGVIYLSAARTISAKISGTGGITKSGTSRLTLSNAANDFGGDITVQGGHLAVLLDTATSTGSMGAATNIVLNGGILERVTSGDYVAASRTITLGVGGGYLRLGGKPVYGRITGPGALMQGYYTGDWIIAGTGNDYAGGTWLSYSGTATVNDGSTLGTGPVRLAQGSRLTVLGNDGIHAQARLYVAATASAYLQGTAPVIGSLEDCGEVRLGTTTGGSALTVGGDDTDFTFHGSITQASAAYAGSLTKTGVGTFTLFGSHTFTGATTVEEGTLALYGALAGDCTVESDAGLAGTGGRVAGDLTVRGTWDVTLRGDTDADSLRVDGVLDIDGATLHVTAADGYSPATGASWTLATGATSIIGTFGDLPSEYRLSMPGDGSLVLRKPPLGSLVLVR